jgi:hypothetical protein
MLLKHESERILDFVARERNRLLPRVRQLGHERSSSSSFVVLVESFFQSLDTLMEKELARIDAIAALQADVASEALDDLFKGLETTLSFFSAVTGNQVDVPRELYDLISWFFELSANVCAPPAYALTSGPELASFDFRRWAKVLFPRFTDLKAALEHVPFFFISIPSWMVPSSRALDWPLIFHEGAHAIENLANFVGPRFPYLPSDWPALNKLAKAGNAQAQEALSTYELTCDFMATYLSGPIFAWRFLKDHFSVSRALHPSYTHPTPELRIRVLLDVLTTQGFKHEARRAEAAINERLGHLTGPAPSPVVIESLRLVQGSYRAKLSGFTEEDYKQKLHRYSRLDTDGLKSELLSKRPVLVDPACLFTILYFDEKCEDKTIAELVADCIRLEKIRRVYQSMGLHG